MNTSLFDVDVTIFLLHGLGAHPITLLPLELALNYVGFKNTHKLSYPVDTLPFEECLDDVYNKIISLIDKDDPIVLIGQSMGGVVSNNLHTRGLNIKHAIYIGSPLHGANLLNVNLKIQNRLIHTIQLLWGGHGQNLMDVFIMTRLIWIHRVTSIYLGWIIEQVLQIQDYG